MSKIAELYVKEVISGSLEVGKVPAKLQKDVKKILADLKKQESMGE